MIGTGSSTRITTTSSSGARAVSHKSVLPKLVGFKAEDSQVPACAESCGRATSTPHPCLNGGDRCCGKRRDSVSALTTDSVALTLLIPTQPSCMESTLTPSASHSWAMKAERLSLTWPRSHARYSRTVSSGYLGGRSGSSIYSCANSCSSSVILFNRDLWRYGPMERILAFAEALIRRRTLERVPATDLMTLAEWVGGSGGRIYISLPCSVRKRGSGLPAGHKKAPARAGRGKRGNLAGTGRRASARPVRKMIPRPGRPFKPHR